jgi:WD40 repeat protein
MAAAAVAAAAAAPAPFFKDPEYISNEGKGLVHALLAVADNCVVTGDGGGMMSHWNLTTNHVNRQWEGHTKRVSGVTALSNGHVASSSWDHLVKTWDLTTGTCVTTLEGHADAVCDVVTLADGRLASSSEDKTVKLWDPRAAACTATLVHDYTVHKLLALPDGRLVSHTSSSLVPIWDVGTQATTHTLWDGDWSYSSTLALLPDGRLVCGGREVITVFNLTTASYEFDWFAHGEKIYSLAVLPTGQLVSSEKGGLLKVWNIKELKKKVVRGSVGGWKKPLIKAQYEERVSPAYTMTMATGGQLVGGTDAFDDSTNQLVLITMA